MKKLRRTSKRILKGSIGRTAIAGLLAVIAIGFVFGLVALRPKADTATTASFQAGVAEKSGNVTQVADDQAGGGQAVRFNAPISQSLPPGTLLDTTFDNYPTGTLSVTNYKQAMGDPTMAAGASNLVNTSIVYVGDGRGNALRQVLPSGGVGGGSGIVTFPKLSQAAEEASLQYDIRFAANFDWGWGGKLPGLGGAASGAAPGTAAGCAAPDGQSWSGRGMWITPGSYGSVTGSNEWIGYMYNYNKKDACGDNIRTRKAFQKGVWHKVKQYYKLNTPGQANGVHRMWLDGVQVINNTSFQYRNNNNLQINYMFWAIFRGGGTADWATPTDGIIDFDNLLITTSP
ncbi:MAG: polysaccharide lyase [Candidatus Saccharimonadales bacterium]